MSLFNTLIIEQEKYHRGRYLARTDIQTSKQIYRYPPIWCSACQKEACITLSQWVGSSQPCQCSGRVAKKEIYLVHGFLLLLSPIFLLNEIFWVYSSHGFWVGACLDRLDILPCLSQTYLISVRLTLRSKLDILSMLREGTHQNVIYMDSKKWG